MTALDQYRELLEAAKTLVKAEEASVKACEALRNSPLDVSRARRTTLNANWSTAAEYRDRCLHRLHVAVVRADVAARWDDSYYGEIEIGDKWNRILVERERP